MEQFECPGSWGWGRAAEDVGRMEKYWDVSARGSELTVKGGIQAEAARWPQWRRGGGGISNGKAHTLAPRTGLGTSALYQTGLWLEAQYTKG